MRIVDIKVLRGPNYWSIYRQHLIAMKLDLEESEDFPTNKIDGFAERLEALIPTLYEHECSENKAGGFFERVREGTWLGHVVEHIALELQSLAGMPCGFGRTRSAGQRGLYHVVFAYKVPRAGIYAAKAAVRIVHALESDQDYDISTDIKELIKINREDGLDPATMAIIHEAKRKNIPYRRLNEHSLIMLGQGINQRLIRGSMASDNGNIGIDIASDKLETRRILSDNFVPLANTESAETGNVYRFLVIDFRLVAVFQGRESNATGNGISQQLDPANQQIVTQVNLDDTNRKIVVEKNLSVKTEFDYGELIYFNRQDNFNGENAPAKTQAVVHPQNIFLAERIARLIHLDHCCIEVIANNIADPIGLKNGGVSEIIAGPGLRLQFAQAQKSRRNIAASAIEILYPNNAPSRIPVVAVTGTNGKTTTTRLISHMAAIAGHSVGYCTTDGIYINGYPIYRGDCTGPVSAESILRDSVVDFALLECARGGILHSGLGFDRCDISVITNIAEDHLGLDDIHRLSDMAKVKSVVSQATFDHGYAILNADDDLVYNIRKELDCKIALFSIDDVEGRVKKHVENGGIGATIGEGFFILYKGEQRMRVAAVETVPLTMNGTATCMIKNIMPAILVAGIREFDRDLIREALHSFIPGPQITPGRMNLFRFRDFEVMIDYAHNAHGFDELARFLKLSKATHKTGIITSPGDRRRNDIKEIGYKSALMFDNIIIRHDKDGRGRSFDELTELLMQGIREVNPGLDVEVISNELEALQYAIDQARPGSLIVHCAEDVWACLQLVEKAMAAESLQEVG